MLAGLSAVEQHRIVIAASVLKCIGKDWKAVEGTFLVNAFGKCENVGREPRDVNGDGIEWISSKIINPLSSTSVATDYEVTHFVNLSSEAGSAACDVPLPPFVSLPLKYLLSFPSCFRCCLQFSK